MDFMISKDFPKLYTFLLTENDALDDNVRILRISSTLQEGALKKAIQDAVNEFLSRPDGKTLSERTNGKFTYKELCRELPADLALAHEFAILDCEEGPVVIDRIDKELACVKTEPSPTTK